MRGFVGVLLVLGFLGARAFYLPGVAPVDFGKGDKAQIKVNKLASTKTQLPYEYYSLGFCSPPKVFKYAENLGEVLRGDRIENSVYEVSMRYDEMCKIACRKVLSGKEAKNFVARIKGDYRVFMILDNLPIAMVSLRHDSKGNLYRAYQRGWPVGFAEESGGDFHYYINNHLRFSILYNRDPATDLSRIVGFEVEPHSIRHSYLGAWPEDGSSKSLQACAGGREVFEVRDPQPAAEGEVIFTYDVVFKSSEVRWALRWDSYLQMQDAEIHWFSIFNSLMIVLFLSGMLAMIMMRTLHRDISKYNQLETAEEAQEESGWKLVYGDVFRPPARATLLSVFFGTGVQVIGMVCITMFFAVLGFLSPANRGGLMTAMLLCFSFMGVAAGYASARLYKQLKGEEWKKTTLRTALFYPGTTFAIFFVNNLLIWGQRSSRAVPFGTLFALCFLWFGIAVPLVFVGSYFGYKAPALEDPVRTNKIPRQIPEQPWYMHPALTIAMGGILPFGAVFIELFFILTSMWMQQYYYLFGFLALVFFILVVTCAEMTIVLTYFQLCSENYHWWWRSFLTSGSSAVYMYAYSIFYFFSKLDVTMFVPSLMYFSYMFIVSIGFFCLCGSIGLFATYYFVRLCYGSVKID